MEFFSVILTAFIIWIAVLNLISFKASRKEKLSLLLVTSVVCCVSYFISESLIMLSATIVIALCLYLKTKRIIQSIVISIISVMSLATADIIVYYFKILFSHTDIINKNNPSYLFVYLCGLIITFIISKILGLILNKKLNISTLNLKGKSALLIVLSLVVTFAIFLFNVIWGQKNGFTDESVQFNLILFSVYFVLLLFIMFVLIASIRKDMQFENTKTEFKNLSEYTKNLETLYNDMRVFRHDYINILSSMVGYIESKDMEGLEQHFNKNILPLSEGMKSNNFKIGLLQNIKIPEIKGILASKVIRAQEMGIDVAIEVVEPILKMSMDIIDLSRSVGILLDNAIEAALKCDKPFIKLALINKENSVLMIIVNGTPKDTPPIHKIYEKGFSTKGENRGLGLYNLKQILGKYNTIFLDTVIENGEFSQALEVRN
ncbi:sensor histidine kinase [Inconstantimicrobium mannanitabidum]|uniref:ATPase n=1 Tax=Inconstantimicrobium mannanitabidum TaxID=1604901 RepID=A0ACB5RIN3_9CLOT|nr:GHKL domain-containing protein [Clostridium sp. TW13]GKX68952.1 ATPase [Clostridium sp. TW13]